MITSKTFETIALAKELNATRKMILVEALRQALAQPEPWDTSDMAHRTGGLSMEQENEACGYAKRLAQAIWEKCYKEESPDWNQKMMFLVC